MWQSALHPPGTAATCLTARAVLSPSCAPLDCAAASTGTVGRRWTTATPPRGVRRVRTPNNDGMICLCSSPSLHALSSGAYFKLCLTVFKIVRALTCQRVPGSCVVCTVSSEYSVREVHGAPGSGAVHRRHGEQSKGSMTPVLCKLGRLRECNRAPQLSCTCAHRGRTSSWVRRAHPSSAPRTRPSRTARTPWRGPTAPIPEKSATLCPSPRWCSTATGTCLPWSTSGAR